MIQQKPILMSTMMVQSLINKIKTITRRTTGLDEVNKHPDEVEFIRFQEYPDGSLRAIFQHKSDDQPGSVKFPYGKVGTVLWVRESFQRRSEQAVANGFDPYYFKSGWNGCNDAGWKPSIHMPRDAARFFLQIKEIRVERLHDITEEDAVAEGVELTFHVEGVITYKDYCNERNYFQRAFYSFRSLWIFIHGEESLKLNPWLWVIKFEQVADLLKSSSFKPLSHVL